MVYDLAVMAKLSLIPESRFWVHKPIVLKYLQNMFEDEDTAYMAYLFRDRTSYTQGESVLKHLREKGEEILFKPPQTNRKDYIFFANLSKDDISEYYYTANEMIYGRWGMPVRDFIDQGIGRLVLDYYGFDVPRSPPLTHAQMCSLMRRVCNPLEEVLGEAQFVALAPGQTPNSWWSVA